MAAGENTLTQSGHFDVLPESAQVAQSVERRTENPCVGGSIPSLGNLLLAVFAFLPQSQKLRFINLRTAFWRKKLLHRRFGIN